MRKRSWRYESKKAKGGLKKREIMKLLIVFILFVFAGLPRAESVRPFDSSGPSEIWKIEQGAHQGIVFFIGPNIAVASFESIWPREEAGESRLFPEFGRARVKNIVLSQKGNPLVLNVKEVIALSASYNLALLRTWQTVSSYFKIRRGSPSASEQLIMPAYIKGVFREMKKIRSLPSDESARFHRFFVEELDLSRAVGSPVLDDQKRVIGIFNKSFAGAFPLVFATKSRYINALINGDIGTQCFFTLANCAYRARASALRSEESPQTLYELAMRLSKGEGAEKDLEKAVDLFRRAGDYPPALYELAMRLSKGEGAEKDLEKAVDLFRRAGDYPPALYELAMRLSKGEGAEKDLEKAVDLFRRAGDYPPALYELAMRLSKGEGIEKDLEKAGEQGYPPALYELAIRHRKGKGVKKDLDLSLRWLEGAARQGHSQAQYELGMAYLKGKADDTNLEQALKWLEKSKEQGHVSAESALLSLNCQRLFY